MFGIVVTFGFMAQAFTFPVIKFDKLAKTL